MDMKRILAAFCLASVLGLTGAALGATALNDNFGNALDPNVWTNTTGYIGTQVKAVDGRLSLGLGMSSYPDIWSRGDNGYAWSSGTITFIWNQPVGIAGLRPMDEGKGAIDIRGEGIEGRFKVWFYHADGTSRTEVDTFWEFRDNTEWQITWNDATDTVNVKAREVGASTWAVDLTPQYGWWLESAQQFYAMGKPANGDALFDYVNYTPLTFNDAFNGTLSSGVWSGTANQVYIQESKLCLQSGLVSAPDVRSKGENGYGWKSGVIDFVWDKAVGTNGSVGLSKYSGTGSAGVTVNADYGGNFHILVTHSNGTVQNIDTFFALQNNTQWQLEWNVETDSLIFRGKPAGASAWSVETSPNYGWMVGDDVLMQFYASKYGTDTLTLDLAAYVPVSLNTTFGDSLNPAVWASATGTVPNSQVYIQGGKLCVQSGMFSPDIRSRGENGYAWGSGVIDFVWTTAVGTNGSVGLGKYSGTGSAGVEVRTDLGGGGHFWVRVTHSGGGVQDIDTGFAVQDNTQWQLVWDVASDSLIFKGKPVGATAWSVNMSPNAGWTVNDVVLMQFYASKYGTTTLTLDSLAYNPGTVSYGRNILLDRGIQLSAYTSLNANGYWSIQDWSDSYFTTLINCGNYPDNYGTRGSFLWGRWAGQTDTAPNLAYGETAYVPWMTSWQFGDESSTSVANFAAWKSAVRADKRFDNVLLFTNQYRGQLNESALRSYVQTSQPDMVFFDVYPFGTATGTPGGSPTSLYAEMSKYRKVALEGYDGTGTSPIAYGMYLQTYVPGVAISGMPAVGYRPSESQIRLNQFAAWAFGFTSATAFVYDQADVNDQTLIFSGPNAYTGRTTEFGYLAATNQMSLKLAPTLVGLVSTDMFIKAGSNSGTAHGITNFAGVQGTNLYITAIDVNNPNAEVNGGADGDVLLGFFKPVDESLDGIAYNNQTYLMVVNGLTQASKMAAECTQTIRVDFNFGSSGITGIQRLNRTTGAVENVALTHISGSQYYVVLTLDGGTGDLFKFNTGAPFVSATMSPAIGEAMVDDFPQSPLSNWPIYREFWNLTGSPWINTTNGLLTIEGGYGIESRVDKGFAWESGVATFNLWQLGNNVNFYLVNEAGQTYGFRTDLNGYLHAYWPGGSTNGQWADIYAYGASVFAQVEFDNATGQMTFSVRAYGDATWQLTKTISYSSGSAFKIGVSKYGTSNPATLVNAISVVKSSVGSVIEPFGGTMLGLADKWGFSNFGGLSNSELLFANGTFDSLSYNGFEWTSGTVTFEVLQWGNNNSIGLVGAASMVFRNDNGDGMVWADAGVGGWPIQETTGISTGTPFIGQVEWDNAAGTVTFRAKPAGSSSWTYTNSSSDMDLTTGKCHIQIHSYGSTPIIIGTVTYNEVIGYDYLADFVAEWLNSDCSIENEWCFTCDWDESGTVNLQDFADIASVWLAW
jgi:hypothetical protein